MPHSFSFLDCCYCKDNSDIFNNGTVLFKKLISDEIHYFVECNQCRKLNIAVSNTVRVFDEYLYGRYAAECSKEIPIAAEVPEGVDEVIALLDRVSKRVDERKVRMLKEERLRVECVVSGL